MGYDIINEIKKADFIIDLLVIMKNFSRSFKSGFTLIELLVVVAIIAIIVSVTLIALNDSKNKGADTAVKTNLNTLRGQSELFYANNGNSFLPPSGSTFSIASCPIYDVSGTNMFSKDKITADAIAEAEKRGSNESSCYNSSIAWAVAVGLKSDATLSWCVDSGGASKQVTTAGAINGTACN
jgi:prepilin-type N-terminal cleavage/methylation domain-containing protein